MNTSNTQKNHDPTLLLPDGRQLGYSEFGRADGQPVLYCHGFPGSRLEAELAHGHCQQHNIRLIAPDRPGYGLSDLMPKQGLEQWPHDVAFLVNQLKVNQFSIIGISGGAPSALAVTILLPEMVQNCSLVCGLAPLTDSRLQAMYPQPSRFGLQLLNILSLPRQLLAKPLAHWLAKHPRQAMQIFMTQASSADRQVMEDEQVSTILQNSLQESFRGQGRGCLADINTYCSPWPLDLQDIQPPVQIWHGLDDKIVSPICSRFYEQIISHSQAHYLPNEGHFSLPINHMPEILKGILENGSAPFKS